MSIKITGTKTLYDEQHIYLIGAITPIDFTMFCKPSDDIAFERNWSKEQRAHYALRRCIRKTMHELAIWLEKNDAHTTYWVDPNIYEVSPVRLPISTYTKFPWGIGFRYNDPLELIFVLRWS